MNKSKGFVLFIFALLFMNAVNSIPGVNAYQIPDLNEVSIHGEMNSNWQEIVGSGSLMTSGTYDYFEKPALDTGTFYHDLTNVEISSVQLPTFNETLTQTENLEIGVNAFLGSEYSFTLGETIPGYTTDGGFDTTIEVNVDYVSTDNHVIESFHDDFTTGSWELYDVDTMGIIYSAYIDQDVGVVSMQPTINYGSYSIADVSWTWQGFEHLFVRKDIPYLFESNYLPSILRLYAKYQVAQQYHYIGVDRCAPFNEMSVTYNNQPTLQGNVNSGHWVNYADIEVANDIRLSLPSHAYRVYAASDAFQVYFRTSESSFKPIITHYLNKFYQNTGMGHAYMQTAHSETLNMRSNVYASDIAVTAGDHVKIECQTLSSEQLIMNLWKNGVIVKSIEVFGNGNTDYSRHIVDLTIDEHVEFDQISFNGVFDDTEYIRVHDVKVEESQGKNFFSHCRVDNFHYDVLNVEYTESFDLFLDEGSTDSRNPIGNYMFFFDSTFFTYRGPIDDMYIPSQTLDIRLTLIMERDVDIAVNIGFSSNNWIVPSFVDLKINGVAVSDTGLHEGFLSLMRYPEELEVTANQDCYFEVSMTTMFSFEIILDVLSRTYLRKGFTLMSDHDVELSSIDFEDDLEIKKTYLNNIDYGAVDPLDFFPLKDFPQSNTFSLEIILLDDMYLPLNQFMERELFDFYHQEFDQETDEMVHSYSLEEQDITIDGNLEMRNMIPMEHASNDWDDWSMNYDPLHSAPNIMSNIISNELTSPFMYNANLEDFYYYTPHILLDGDLAEVDGDSVIIYNPTNNYQSEEYSYYNFRINLDSSDLSFSNGFYLDYHVDRTSFIGANGNYGAFGYYDSGSVFRVIVDFSSNRDQIISGRFLFDDPSMEFEPGRVIIQFSSFGEYISNPEEINFDQIIIIDQMRFKGHGDTVATIERTLDFPLFHVALAPSLQNVFRITTMIDVISSTIIDIDADIPSTVTIALINGVDLITQEMIFELNPSVDPIPILQIELSNMEVELHINYKIEFLCLNTLHEYPGTYTFEDGIVPVKWQVESGSLDDVHLISELQGHSNVLEVNSAEIFDTLDVNQEQGILEAWILSPSIDNYIGVLGFLSDTPSPDGSSLGIGFVNGQFACTNSTGLVQLPISYDANRWYHVKIDFNTDLGVYHAWIDDIPVHQGEPFTITNADGSSLSKTVIASYSSFHVDGIGYSWDPEYSIGDNKISFSEQEIYHYFTMDPSITQENHDPNALKMYCSFDVSFSPTTNFDYPYHFPDFARNLFSCRISIMTEDSTETWDHGFDHDYMGTVSLDITEMLHDRNKKKMFDVRIEIYIIGVDTSVVIDDLKLTSEMISLQLTETPRTTVNGVLFSEEMLATRDYDHWFFETKINASNVSLFNEKTFEFIEDLTKEGDRYFFDSKCSENDVLTATIEHDPNWFVLYEVLEHDGTYTKIRVDYKADFPIMNVDLILDFGNDYIINDDWNMSASQNPMTHELTIPGIFFTSEMRTLYIEGYSVIPHAVISSHESDQGWNHITTTTEIDYVGFITYPKYTHAFFLNKKADWNAYNIHYGTETYASETISDTLLKVSGDGFDPSIEDSYLHFRTLPFKEVDFVFENNIIIITIRTSIDVQNCYFMYSFDPTGVHELIVIESNISIYELTDSGDLSGYLYFACTEIKEGLTIIKIAVNFATPLEMIVQSIIIFVIAGVLIGVYYYMKNNERKLQEIKGFVYDKVISKLKREKDDKGLINVQIDTKNNKIIINFKNE